MSNTEHVDTVVVGAGHAGLAVSRLLTEAGREHLVLDRGDVAERWRSERWDSLHLLTPSWMTRLPGWYYCGGDPEGFLSAAQLVTRLEHYAVSFDAPVRTRTTVLSVVPTGDREYDVRTDGGTIRTRNVVVATGPHGPNRVPSGLVGVRADVVPSSAYKNPDRLAPGGVLVVGASSSGVQIADELQRSGRDVVLAVGRHTRVPRRYRGLDLFWWLDSTGRLARTVDELVDAERARREPSLQIVGRPDPRDRGEDLDLPGLHQRGVRLVGRLQGINGGTASFADDLDDHLATADRGLHRLLGSFDRYAERQGLGGEVLPATRPGPFEPGRAPHRLRLAAEGIGTVVLAAGHRPDHSWLPLPITAADGSIRQYRGVAPAPGIYVVGQRFQHRRDSGFIDGARHDARDVVTHLLTGSLPGAAVPSSEEPAA